MTKRIAPVFVALATLVAAPAYGADFTGTSLTVEAFGGWQSLNVNSGAAGVVNSTTENNAIIGGDLLLKAGLFGIGVVLDKGLSGNVQPWDGSVMAGLLFDVLPSLRIEALGEIGRRGIDFGDMFNSSGQTFLGVRPGVSFRLLPSPIRIGAAVPVRWRTSGPGAEFGSPDWSIIGKVGVEFP